MDCSCMTVMEKLLIQAGLVRENLALVEEQSKEMNKLLELCKFDLKAGEDYQDKEWRPRDKQLNKQIAQIDELSAIIKQMPVCPGEEDVLEILEKVHKRFRESPAGEEFQRKIELIDLLQSEKWQDLPKGEAGAYLKRLWEETLKQREADGKDPFKGEESPEEWEYLRAVKQEPNGKELGG